MTAFSATQLPASVDTVEKLVVWAASVLQEINFDTQVVEVQGGTPIPVATSNGFQVRTTSYSGIRCISRVSIPVDVSKYGTSKLYDAVTELSSDPIPSAYQS